MSNWTFGSFSFCHQASFPLCDLFPDIPHNCATTSPDPFYNLAEFIASIVALLITLYYITRCFRKRAAVGRKEMMIFFLWYMATLVTEALLSISIIHSSSAAKYVGAVGAGTMAGTAIALVLNGFVGFQWLDDGTTVSLLGVFGASALYAIVVGYLAGDAAFQINFSVTNSNPVDIPLYITYLLVPAACVLVYTITTMILVFKYLRSRRPIGFISLALLAFILAQLFLLFINEPICNSTNGNMDTRWLGTVWTAIAVFFVYKFWNSVTEDDWEDPFSQH
jgi:glucan phosphoethanolaminetransferase (alkaline phosphatase superfamily)